MSDYNTKYVARRRAAGKIGGFRQSVAFLPDGTYQRAAALAEEQCLRLPVIIGQLAELGLATLSPTVSNPPAVPSPLATDKNQIVDLTRAILASRYPDDTGSTRMRQLSLITLIAAEIERGNRPVATAIARQVGANPEQITTLARTLKERGVLIFTKLANYNGKATANMLSISPMAVENLRMGEVVATGSDAPGKSER